MQDSKSNKPRSSKLLIVSFAFFPDDSPNTYRWKNIIDKWVEKGIDVFVVSAQKPGFCDYEIANGIKIYRTGRSLFQRIKTKIGNHSSANLAVSNNKRSISKEGLLRKVYNISWKKLYWPDWAFLSYYPTLKLARKIIEREEIINMISVSWPFTDHLIGYKLKKEYNLFWLAEIIDPFSFNDAINNQRIYSKLNFSVEKKVLGKADLVTVMTNNIRAKYVSQFPELSSKISVIHNLYVPEIQRDTLNVKCKTKTTKFVFVGTLSLEVRSPRELLKIFKMLLDKKMYDNIELHFYGKINSNIQLFSSYSELINSSIFIHGPVSKDKVTDILLDADILVNIGNSNPYQEPSKIIEYIYLGKPILNVCSLVNDSSREILDKYPLNLNIFKSEIENDDTINKLIQFLNKDFYIDSHVIDKILTPYLLVEVEKAYFNLFWNKKKSPLLTKQSSSLEN